MTLVGAGSDDASDFQDLNVLLAEEQTANMNAEAAPDVQSRDAHRGLARAARNLTDATNYPNRQPYDFDRPEPAGLVDMWRAPVTGVDPFAGDFEMLKQRVAEMDQLLTQHFVEGRVGIKHNIFQHRARMVRQAKGRLAEPKSGGGRLDK